MATFVGRFRNCIFVSVLVITSFVGSLFILFPLLPLLFINRPVWRRVVDQIIGLWLCLPVGMLDYMYGMKFRVTGDQIRSSEKAVIVMNHRTRLDWLFSWSALYRMDVWLLTTEKIILKAPLRRMLGAGWAMECNSFIFLERAMEKDAVILSDSAGYLSSTGNSYQILIFPEGTDLTADTISKSDAYAERKNLPLYRNVLHPRTNGLSHLIRGLKLNGGIDYIYDVTVAYPNEIVQTEMEFAVTGGHPSAVDFHCRRYRVEEIFSSKHTSGDKGKSHSSLPVVNPGDDEVDSNVERWCKQVWQEKEMALSRYYGYYGNNNRSQDEEKQFSLEEAFGEYDCAGDGLKTSTKGSCEINVQAKAIDCYVCTSINRSDAYCEDAFNTSYPGIDYLQKECMGYRKDRKGYFPADHCIKISGVSTKNYSHSIMIRTCALDSGTLTADTEIVRMSHCGHFIFDGVPFSGCVQSCHTDGCNLAVSLNAFTFLITSCLCIVLVNFR